MPAREMIRKFIATELLSDGHGVELTFSEPLIDSGIVDSLGIMSLIGYLEENFKIQVAGEDLIPENFASIDIISTFVTQKCAGHLGGTCGL